MALDQSKSELREIGDVEVASAPAGAPQSPADLDASFNRGKSSHRMVWGACGLILGAIAGATALWFGIRFIPAPPLMRFEVNLPRDAPLSLKANPLAFSPDGSHLVYVAQVGDDTELYVRALDRTEAMPVSGTKSASSPFFSPDGNWIGYFDSHDATLKKVALTGEEPVILGKAQLGLGACWGTDGSIIYTPDGFSGLWRLPAGGGNPEPLTRLHEKEFTHRWPEILPDKRTVIFTIGMAGTTSVMHVAAFSLRTGQRKVLLEGASDARYSPSGHLLFLSRGNLMAVRFDAARLKIRGIPFLVKESIKMDAAAGAGHFACSRTGALAYALAGEEEDMRSLIWADRQGGVERLVVTRGAFSYPRLSPDGRLLAIIIRSLEGQSNLWVVDHANGVFTRLTFEGNSILPVWTPDGKRLTFASDREGQWNIFWMPADGSGAPELLNKCGNPQMPSSWSPDGKILAFTEIAPDSGADIWTLSVAGGVHTAQPLLRTGSSEWSGTFSPDGRWLAYTSDDSGLPQVYVRPFPGPGERYQLSTAEGREPVWSRDGREVFFRCWNGLMSVGIQSEPEFNPAPPRLVVSGEYETGENPVFPNYDIAPDGQRFVLIPREPREKRQINIDLNWFRDLKSPGGTDAGGSVTPGRNCP